ncbi:hypothetical protein C5167_041528 [Papaver somniferum]|nr:hypothetical protein C5167_041528 [Papaver somniferum]
MDSWRGRKVITSGHQTYNYGPGTRRNGTE